jgi:hypothetical protein
MAHLTVCPVHLARVRQWLRGKAEDGQVITVSTTKLLNDWEQVMSHAQLPVWGMANVG